LLDIIAKGFRLIASYLEKPRRKHKVHAGRVKQTSKKHDMLMRPDESFYAAQYLHWIKHSMTNLFPQKSATMLDFGCGQGRLSIPVSHFSRKVVGVDFTPEAIEKAKHYSSKHEKLSQCKIIAKKYS
jgi:2-polyprenyl-3-methyl-5-hydroxy-6-metoxy-1,4-benzoquinol methylase